MATLDRWRSFLEAPKTMELVHAELIGRDPTQPLMVGPAQIRMQSLQDFSYNMNSIKEHPIALFRAIEHQHQNSFDATARLRLFGKDADGTDWSCGWTMPKVVNLGSWAVEGKLTALDITDRLATETHSTELLFRADLLHPLARIMGVLGGPRQKRFERRLEILGSALDFSYERANNVVSIVASHSEQLRPTYTERWLCEPLRIMFGQPIQPRLFARNIGREAIVFILPVPRLDVSSWSAFLSDEFSHPDKFFDCYSQLLTMIALAGDISGEAHPVTRFYDELAQVANASRWVIALTIAGCTEGLEKVLRKNMATGEIPEEPRSKDADDLAEKIEKLEAPSVLKRRAIKALLPPKGASTVRTLRALQKRGVISSDQLKAWEKLRHAVMHGELISPYSNEDEDKQLMDLFAIVRALTRELVDRAAQVEVAEASLKLSMTAKLADQMRGLE